MDTIATYIEFYLPVFIPVFLAIISVLTGIVTKRIERTLNGLLKIHSDLVIGLFSFVIWALVAYQQNLAIHLNKEYDLSLIRVVLLLFANIILLIAGQIVLNVSWTEKSAENVGNGLFLALTAVAVFAPVMLKTPRVQEPVSKYVVSIPYLDSSMASHIGPGNWDERYLCEVTDVTASDRQAAIDRALAAFRGTARSTLALSKKGRATEVKIEDKRIVVEAVR
jgi:hypothetical protein